MNTSTSQLEVNKDAMAETTTNPESNTTAPANSQNSTKPATNNEKEKSDNNRYDMLGLLDIFKSPNADILVKGNDLKFLGFDFNSDEKFYSTFGSPFSNSPMINTKTNFKLPECYNIPQMPYSTLAKINKFSEEVLFYMFYNMPQTYFQEAAAQELFNRKWRYHKKYSLWFSKEPGNEAVSKGENFEKGIYIIYDPISLKRVKTECILYYSLLEDRATNNLSYNNNPYMMKSNSINQKLAANAGGFPSYIDNAAISTSQTQQPSVQANLNKMNSATATSSNMNNMNNMNPLVNINGMSAAVAAAAMNINPMANTSNVNSLGGGKVNNLNMSNDNLLSAAVGGASAAAAANSLNHPMSNNSNISVSHPPPQVSAANYPLHNQNMNPAAAAAAAAMNISQSMNTNAPPVNPAVMNINPVAASASVNPAAVNLNNGNMNNMNSSWMLPMDSSTAQGYGANQYLAAAGMNGGLTGMNGQMGPPGPGPSASAAVAAAAMNGLMGMNVNGLGGGNNGMVNGLGAMNGLTAANMSNQQPQPPNSIPAQVQQPQQVSQGQPQPQQPIPPPSQPQPPQGLQGSTNPNANNSNIMMGMPRFK